ncbi:fatty acid desaturase-domain-containing protein [Gautieria morchelliformis]|nr:fatty acid desaturase-domain-containing protein [Gautieria morchelliformis]
MTTKRRSPAPVEQVAYIVPDLTVKDLLSVIPAHCFKRSAFRSSLYVVWDFILLYTIYTVTTFTESYISPSHLSLPHPILYRIARFALWSVYGFSAGLVATGLWVIAHECGHQAFSEYKIINNAVGWVLHSALGVPYHSWRITHGKHHATTAHLTSDQVFVPRTRAQLKLPKFQASKEDLAGSTVAEEVQKELRDAFGDSPIGAALGAASYLIAGWPMYLIRNASGQKHYPPRSNHFYPSQPLFSPHQYSQVLVSDVGIFLWLAGIVAWSMTRGFGEMFRIYLVPYLWVNHWLVLITFLQHTDPLLPHYRQGAFTFPRGALSTLDRSLLGGLGKFAGWIGGSVTHGISETHVLHHVSSKIPHYNAWEASDALRKRLAEAGYDLQGPPGGWSEVFRVFRECKFVEDTGDVVFYKNARGLAAARGIFTDGSVSDSGVELSK